MSDIIETVTVVRDDHPAGRVDINKCDMQEGDVIYKAEQKPSKAELKAEAEAKADAKAKAEGKGSK